MIIVPSILTDSLETVQEQIQKTRSLGLNRVQIDIVDPEFADNITVQPVDLLEVNLQHVDIDIHLMTNDPINDVVECSQIEGVKTIIAQIERMRSQSAFIEHVESYALGVGFSLDLYTPVEEIEEDSFPHLSIVQVMGNRAGRQGQDFVGEQALAKIRELDDLRKTRTLSFLIAVDIGMTPAHAKACAQAGADIVTPGSFLWTAPDLAAAIAQYRQ